MAGKEKSITNRILLEATKLGSRLFRNNCGTAQFGGGQFVKYGVANPGGSDLIGWVTVVIDQNMVGKKVAIFTAIEVKTPGVATTAEQAAFVKAVRSAGGVGEVVRSVEEGIAALEPRLV